MRADVDIPYKCQAQYWLDYVVEDDEEFDPSSSQTALDCFLYAFAERAKSPVTSYPYPVETWVWGDGLWHLRFPDRSCISFDSDRRAVAVEETCPLLGLYAMPNTFATHEVVRR